MLFASDLDRTLIYSKKFLHVELMNKIKLVETRNDTEISYMLNSSIEVLKEIAKRVLFIPVTTRSIEQYNRIDIFKNEIKPKYFVVSNGGKIFINENMDINWHNKMTNSFGKECLELELVYNEIQNNHKIGDLRIVDDLFLYLKLDHRSANDFKDTNIWLRNNNWRSILNGRKLYFIPNHINKGDAVKYIANREGISNIITSGDSFVDYEMAKISSSFISPKHGTLHGLDVKDKKIIKFTEMSGMHASYEILKYVLKEVV